MHDPPGRAHPRRQGGSLPGRDELLDGGPIVGPELGARALAADCDRAMHCVAEQRSAQRSAAPSGAA